jgi:hypothetical protein
MAAEEDALLAAYYQQAQAIANLQRTVDQLQQQLGLLTQALVHLVRGEWDAGRYGALSAEAFVVALSPELQGKVNAVRFEVAR